MLRVVSMPCMRCGAPGISTGDGHLCPEHGGLPPAAPDLRRPSTAWQVLTWVFVALTIGYAGLLVANLGALAAANAIVDRILAQPSAMSTPLSRMVFDLADLLNLVTRTWIWLYLVGFVCWTFSSRFVVRRLGYERNEILSHWTIVAWRVTLFAVIGLGIVVFGRTVSASAADDPAVFRDAFIGHGQALMAYTVLRIGMLALLSAYAIIVRRRLTRTPGRRATPDLRRFVLFGGGAAVVGLAVVFFLGTAVGAYAAG